MRQLLPLGCRAALGTLGGGGRAFRWGFVLDQGRRGPETLLEVPGRDPNSALGVGEGILRGFGWQKYMPFREKSGAEPH